MQKKLAVGIVLTAWAGLIGAAPVLAGDGRIEAFAGYYFAEELEEDISYGLRGGWDSGSGWGLMLSYEQFEVDGKGYGEPSGVDAELAHLELSFVAYPGGGGWELFSGIGGALVDVDLNVPGAVVDLDKTTLSIHGGVAYRFDLGDSFYLRPELRARTYDTSDLTLDFTGSLAFGFRWNGGQ